MSAQQPETLAPAVAWRPNPGPQTRALASSAFELLYGGAVAGGKTDWLVAKAHRLVPVSGKYRGILFRRTKEDLKKAKGLLERAGAIYTASGARQRDLTFLWPNGARIDLAGLEHEKDVLRYKGAEFDFVGFDELTEFTRFQYLYMFSRVRGSSGLPKRVGSTSNPGSDGHEWVLERWAPWIYPPGHPEYGGELAEDGQRLWYFHDEETDLVSVSSVPRLGALSRTMIKSTMADTPQLSGDVEYRARLNAMPQHEREQLRDGNWLRRMQRGDMFQRAWFSDVAVGARPATIVDSITRPIVARCRYWDLAASEKKPTTKPAATASVRLALDVDGNWWVEDVTQDFKTPGAVEDLVLSYAITDSIEFGNGCPTVVEFDPGQAASSQMLHFGRLLVGRTWHHQRPQGDKPSRAKPASSAAEHARLFLLRNARWNSGYVDELADFPFGALKDRVDATSGAMHWLATRRPVKLPPPGGAPTRIAAQGTGGY